MRLRRCLPLLVLAVAFADSRSAPPTYAIVNARIVVSADKTLPKGVIVLRNGLIQAVGESVPIPSDARIYDAKGLTVYPGLIDAATSYGAPVARTTTATTTRSAATQAPENPESGGGGTP